MKIGQMKNSKFLSKDDCGDGILVTIKGDVTQENVAMEGAEETLKWCLHFVETDKPLVLNGINNQMIAKITGSDDTENWDGQKIVLYNDPNVGFAGKITGGIRVRAPRKAQPSSTSASSAKTVGKNVVAKPSPAPTEPQSEDEPF